MELQAQVIPISFKQGLNTKVDPKQIVTGQLLVLQNGIFISPQQITKRNGFLSLSNNYITLTSSGGPVGTITSGNSITTLQSKLVLTDNFNVYGEAQLNNQFVASGKMVSVGTTISSIGGLATTTAFPAETTLGNYKLLVAPNPPNQPTDQISISYLDLTNERVVHQPGPTNFTYPTPSYMYTAPFAGNFFLGVYGSNVLNLYTLPAVPGIGGTNVGTLSIFDAFHAPAFAVSSTLLYVLYVNGAGALKLNTYNTAYALVNSVTIGSVTSPAAYDVTYDAVNSEVIVTYTPTTTSITVARYSTTLTLISTVATVSTSTVTRLTAVIVGVSLAVFANAQVSGSFYPYIQPYLIQSYRTTPVTIPYSPIAYGAYITSKPFFLNGYVYLSAAHPATIDATNFVFQWDFNTTLTGTSGVMDAFTVVAKYATGQAYFDPASNKIQQGLQVWNGLSIPFFSADQLQDVGAVISANYVIKEVTLNFSTKNRSVELAQNTNFTGGSIRFYDGYRSGSNNFNNLPLFISGTTNQPGPTYSYSYYAIYTFTDFQGNLYRSGRSNPGQVITGTPVGTGTPLAFNTVTFTAYSIDDAYKLTSTIDVYRTAANGTIYYKIASAAANGIADVTLSDSVPDSVAIGNQQLYTTDGEVDNLGPPAAKFSTSFKNRMVIVSSDDPLQWWYSKQVIEGFPVEFSDLFVSNIDQKGGPITAVSTMDDKLIFFKNSNIWYVIGDGPAPNGTSNDFTYPQIISSDTGCINQDSIILTPTGLFFQSPKGIYLLGRDLSLNYVGAPVEQYNSNTVTSAQMIANTNQVRFTLDNGICLMFDYIVTQWGTFTNVAAVDSTIYLGNHTYLTSTGIANQESVGQYYDQVNTPIALSLTTGWLSFGNVQGFQRVKKFLILTEALNNDTLNVQLNFDYGRYSASPITIPVVGSSLPQQHRIFPQWQKCENMQISLTEAPSSVSTTFKLSHLMLEVAVKKGAFKLSAGNSYG